MRAPVASSTSLSPSNIEAAASSLVLHRYASSSTRAPRSPTGVSNVTYGSQQRGVAGCVYLVAVYRMVFQLCVPGCIEYRLVLYNESWSPFMAPSVELSSSLRGREEERIQNIEHRKSEKLS